MRLWYWWHRLWCGAPAEVSPLMTELYGMTHWCRKCSQGLQK